jgi:transcriptional regulator with XRE-family HTH domain
MFAGNGDGAMETFGQRLRGFRKASGLHQEELAAHVGLPTTAISKIENGTRDVTLVEAQALARVLHMELGTLAGGPEEGLGSTLHRLVLACSVESRQDTIGLLRGLADVLEASLPDTPGRDEVAYRSNGLAPHTAMRSAEPNTGPPHPSIMRSNALSRAWVRGVARTRRATRWSPMLPLSLALALGVFLLDISLPLGVVVGIPHVAVVALAACALRWRAVVGVALGCTGLTLLGFVGSPPGTPAWFDITNRALALGTLWATMFLVRRSQRGEVALRQPHANGYAPLWR